MTLFELRQAVEQAVPWWTPLLPLVLALPLYIEYRIRMWRWRHFSLVKRPPLD